MRAWLYIGTFSIADLLTNSWIDQRHSFLTLFYQHFILKLIVLSNLYIEGYISKLWGEVYSYCSFPIYPRRGQGNATKIAWKISRNGVFKRIESFSYNGTRSHHPILLMGKCLLVTVIKYPQPSRKGKERSILSLLPHHSINIWIFLQMQFFTEGTVTGG